MTTKTTPANRNEPIPIWFKRVLPEILWLRLLHHPSTSFWYSSCSFFNAVQPLSNFLKFSGQLRLCSLVIQIPLLQLIKQISLSLEDVTAAILHRSNGLLSKVFHLTAGYAQVPFPELSGPYLPTKA